MRRLMGRLRRMTAAEVRWRGIAAARIAWDRARTAVYRPAWDRTTLASALAPTCELAPVRDLLFARRWRQAHVQLAHHFLDSPARFVVAPAFRGPLAERILDAFPDSGRASARAADRICGGCVDVLGYRDLRFSREAPGIDWHYDPVHARRAPERFWASVPFLDQASGDHKVIWEINRHQSWLQLGRAFWLTGDARYRREALEQLASWLDANPPLMGINWASMLELAFRSISWLWALNFFVEDAHGDDEPWLVDLLTALDRQLAHVEHNLSWYFSPNTHLLGEGLALYIAGSTVPLLRASEHRRRLGRRILIDGAVQQLAADGVHCERSTHYHRYALDFYLLALAVARITDDPAAETFAAAAGRLAAAARVLSDNSGRVPHIGDDDGGMLVPIAGRAPDDLRDSLATASVLLERPELSVGPAPEETFWMLAHPMWSATLERARHAAPASGTTGSTALADAGYYVSRSSGGSHLVVDAGPHGYLNGGHAHADALSMTLSISGEPLLIDPGTGSYTEREWRDRFRSSMFHNTVSVDDRSQSTPAGPFHWRRTAAARARCWRINPMFDYFEGTHDGYAPLVHQRHILAVHDDLVIVADVVSGAEEHAIHAHWHVDPGWTITASDRHVIFRRSTARATLTVTGGSVDIRSGTRGPAAGDAAGWYSPVYGRVERATTIRVRANAPQPGWLVSVFGLRDANAVQGVDFLPVGSAATPAVAFRIRRAASTDVCVIADPHSRWPVGWSAAGFYSDARLLYCRVEDGVTSLILVDASIARALGHPWLEVESARALPDFHVTVTDVLTQPDVTAHMCGGVPGARVRFHGRDMPVVAGGNLRCAV